jgi:hypothetical protein
LTLNFIPYLEFLVAKTEGTYVYLHTYYIEHTCGVMYFPFTRILVRTLVMRTYKDCVFVKHNSYKLD